MRSRFLVTGPLLPCYLDVMDIDIREKRERLSILRTVITDNKKGGNLDLIKHVDINKTSI